MEVEHGMYRTAAKVSDCQFGGDVFTQVLQGFLMTEFNRFGCSMSIICGVSVVLKFFTSGEKQYFFAIIF